MMPEDDYVECHSPDFNLDYSPIKLQRNASLDKRDKKEMFQTPVDKFKLKLRHTSTLPIYELEEEKKFENNDAPKKPKKLLKLVTNTQENEMEKSKSFSPQPITHTNSIGVHSNFFSFLPSKSFKRNNSVLQNDEFHYYEEYYDVTTRKGSLKHQQDKFTAICNDKLKPYDLFFGVFDGHRTSIVSEFLSENLNKYIQNHINYDSNPELAIKEGFQKLDEELLNYQKKTNAEGGSTALCALIKETALYIMNVGDSIAAFIKDGKITKINEEHNTGNEKEKIHMEKKGALIIKIKNIFRIMGEIAVTRSFGDKAYKEYLTCEPDVHKYDMNDFKNDGLLLIGSDGYWNLCHLEKTLTNVNKWKAENENKIEGLTDFLISEIYQNFDNVKKDNMTLIAIDLTTIANSSRKSLRNNSIIEEKSLNFLEMCSSGHLKKT